MKLLEKSEFTNRNRDKVVITLWENESGGFQLIVGSERSRKEEEKRVIGGELVTLHSTNFSNETKIIQLPTKGSALNEFNLYRFLESEPGYTIKEYSQWQEATNSGESV